MPVAALAVALALALSAAAAPGAAQPAPGPGVAGGAAGAGAVWLDGEVRGTAEAAALFLSAATLSAAEGRVQVWNLPLEELRLNARGEAYVAHRVLDAELVAEGPAAAGAYAASARDGLPPDLRLLPPAGADSFQASFQGPSASFSPVGRPRTTGEDRPAAFNDVVAGHRLRPAGDASMVTLPGASLRTGPAAVVLVEGRLDGPAGVAWLAGQRLNHSRSAFDPVTGSGRLVYDTHVVVLDSPALALELPARHELAATAAAGRVDGVLRWSGLDAAVEVDGRAVPPAQLLRIDGTLGYRADLGDGPASWSIDGRAAGLAVDGVAWTWEEMPVAAGGATLAVAAVAWLAVRPLARGDPLRHPARRRILALVHDRQTVRCPELGAELGLSATATKYHVRVLRDHGILQECPEPAASRGATYMLNSGSLRFTLPTPGGTLNVGAAIAAIHGHPARRAIAAALEEHGPLDYRGLAAKAGLRGPQSSITYHLQLLASCGAVSSRWEGRRKVYALEADLRQVRRLQYRSFLILHGLLPAAALLAERGEVDPASVARPMRRRLRSLGRLGLAALDGGRYRLDPRLAALGVADP